jgi:DNA repair protein RadC
MNNPFQSHDTNGFFHVLRPVTPEEILSMARQLIQQHFKRGQAMTSPEKTREFLMLELAMLEHEVFYCIYLDNQHKILVTETSFLGTIDSASVYPREIVKRALALNASAVILAHNHPSGMAEPSEADRKITQQLKDTLALIDVRVLDHFLIGGVDYFSFAERGLL